LNDAVFKDVRLISVPVRTPTGQIAMALTLFEFSKPEIAGVVQHYIECSRRAAAKIEARLAYSVPHPGPEDSLPT